MPQDYYDYDVFLSHSSTDKPWVRKLKKDLYEYGVKAWLDEDEIRPGTRFAAALEQALATSRTVALIVSREGVSSQWVMEEYFSALQAVPIIPVILGEAKLPRFLQGRHWVDFRDETKYDQNLRQLVWGITGKEPVQTRHEDISAFIKFLEEITREDRSKERRYKFIDPRGYMDLLTTKGHHVIFGGRGSGKSAFLRELENTCKDHKIMPILVDLGIANVSYPYVLLVILIAIFNQLRDVIVAEKYNRAILATVGAITLFREGKLVKDLERTMGTLDKLYSQPSSSVQTISAALESDIHRYRELVVQWLGMMDYRAIYLLIDDFYQLPPESQPEVADYLKKLFRGLSCYLKMGTVPSRSRLFARNEFSEIGLQRADDYSPIHLDFLLEDFDGAQRFLSDLFDNICSQGIEDFRGNVLFEDRVDAMNILTEASGGNPRSFINLLKELLIYYKPQLSPLGYHEIRRVCVNYLKRARQEAVESYSNYELLHQLLTVIVDLCQRHHDIAFCLSKYEIHAYPKLGGLISQLVDLRLIHLLTTSYPPPVGDRLIYVLSVGVYDELGDPYDYWKNERLTNRIFNSTKDYPQLECSELPLHILS